MSRWSSELDLIMQEYSNNYSKISGSLWQYDRPETIFNKKVTAAPGTINSEPFKYLKKFTGSITEAQTIKDVIIAGLLKYLSNFLRELLHFL